MLFEIPNLRVAGRQYHYPVCRSSHTIVVTAVGMFPASSHSTTLDIPPTLPYTAGPLPQVPPLPFLLAPYLTWISNSPSCMYSLLVAILLIIHVPIE